MRGLAMGTLHRLREAVRVLQRLPRLDLHGSEAEAEDAGPRRPEGLEDADLISDSDSVGSVDEDGGVAAEEEATRFLRLEDRRLSRTISRQKTATILDSPSVSSAAEGDNADIEISIVAAQLDVMGICHEDSCAAMDAILRAHSVAEVRHGLSCTTIADSISSEASPILEPRDSILPMGGIPEGGQPLTAQNLRAFDCASGASTSGLPFPAPPFDGSLAGQILEGELGLREQLSDPACLAVRVSDLKDLVGTIRDDMGSYCRAHSLDESFNHVCKDAADGRRCRFNHKGVAHVEPGNANGEIRPLPPNMHLIVGRYVKPWTRRLGLSYAGALLAHRAASAAVERSSEDDGGARRAELLTLRAEAFISHNWDEHFEDFVTTAVNVLDQDTLVWVCSLSLDQNKDIGETLGTDLREVPFARALRGADRVIAFLDHKAVTLTRCWVVFEAYLAVILENKTFHVSLPDDSDRDAWDAVAAKLQDLDVRKSEASVQRDRDAIMDYLDGQELALNVAVKQAIQRACDHASALNAASTGHLAALMRHSEPLCADAGYTTTLHLAARAGCVDTVEYLLQCKAELTSTNKDGDTALHFAAHSGKVEAVTKLMAAGADAGATNHAENTPLLLAAQEGQLSTVFRLVDLRADLSAANDAGETALHRAAAGGHVEVVEALISMGAERDASAAHGRTGLHLAATLGRAEVVRLLVGLNSAVDAVDAAGESPLHGAASGGHSHTVELLIELGSDLNCRSTRGWTSLHYASHNGPARGDGDGGEGHTQTVEGLIQRGMPVDCPTKSRRTPLHLTAVMGHVSTLVKLLELGAQLDAADKTGRSPLHYAAAFGQTEAAQQLVQWAADLNARNSKGCTPLEEAISQRHAETVEALRQWAGKAADDEDVCPTLHRALTSESEIEVRQQSARHRESRKPARCSVM